MGFGRARAARPKIARSRLAFAGLLVGEALVCAIALGGCGLPERIGAFFAVRRELAFASALKALDSSLATSLDDKKTGIPFEQRKAVKATSVAKAFEKAQTKAGQPEEWLSLLKRCPVAEVQGDAGRSLIVADKAGVAFPRSESLAAARAHAYLRASAPGKALELFAPAGPIEPEARRELWAEAFIAAASSGQAPNARASDYGRLAEITGDPRAYGGAAAAALASGDKVAAEAWLARAHAAGGRIDLGLYWDCGLYGQLASLPDSALPEADYAASLALMGDASWMIGDAESARQRWAKSIALEPYRSWKPYAELALLAGEARRAGEVSELAESYWARLRAAFLSGPDSSLRAQALCAYAAQLARSGREEEAIRMLQGGGSSSEVAVLLMTVQGRKEPEKRLVADLERLAAERPGDGLVMGTALRTLFVRGMLDELALLRTSAQGGKGVEYGWFYDAAIEAAKGEYAAAAETLSGGLAGDAPPAAGLYALGSLYRRSGDLERAAVAFSRAASGGRSPSERCAAYMALGGTFGEEGDSSSAQAAYASALAADPKNPEAAIASRGASRGAPRDSSGATGRANGARR